METPVLRRRFFAKMDDLEKSERSMRDGVYDARYAAIRMSRGVTGSWEVIPRSGFA